MELEPEPTPATDHMREPPLSTGPGPSNVPVLELYPEATSVPRPEPTIRSIPESAMWGNPFLSQLRSSAHSPHSRTNFKYSVFGSTPTLSPAHPVDFFTAGSIHPLGLTCSSGVAQLLSSTFSADSLQLCPRFSLRQFGSLPLTSRPMTPPWLCAPSALPWSDIIWTPPGSLVPLATTWSLVTIVPQTSGPPLSTPLAPQGSSFLPAPPWSSSPLVSPHSARPPSSPQTAALPWTSRPTMSPQSVVGL